MTRRPLVQFRLLWIAFMVVVTSVPYIANWRATPTGYHYTWILPPYPDDSFGYMMWAQQAAHGSLLFKIKYTALPHGPFLFHPFFLICGWIERLLHFPIGVVFFLMKAVGVALFLGVFYRFIDYLGLTPRQSIIATVMVGISSGLGGVFAAMGLPIEGRLSPADLWVPEVSTYYALLTNPFFPFSLALMLLVIWWGDRGTREGRVGDLWRSGVTTGMITLIHPYAVPLLFLFVSGVAVARRRSQAARYLVPYFTAALPIVIYTVVVSRVNPIVARHNELGVMKSPSALGLLMGFGLPLVIVLASIFLGGRKEMAKYGQIVFWFLLSVTLAYVPFWFQRKLIFGAHVALCVLAAIAVDIILARFADRRKLAAVGGAIILLPCLVATPLYLFFSQRAEVRRDTYREYFISHDLMQALHVLRQNTRPDDIVFARPATSRFIPAFAGNTVL